MMNLFSSVRTALASIWRNKLTSLLSVLGVVIGVTSVSTLVSVGEGLKKDVSSMIQGMGTNVMVIISGKMDLSDPNSMNQSNPANFVSTDILTLDDVKQIQEMPDIEAVSPMSLVAGTMSSGDKKATPTIAGVYPSVFEAMQVLKMDKGKVFSDDTDEKVVVLGPKAKEALFGDENPIDKKIEIGKGTEFTVVGTTAQSSSSASFASELDTIAFIPLNVATELSDGEVKILRIIMKANDNADVSKVKKEISEKLIASHGEEDFTIMTQDDILDLFGTFLNMATALVSAIAAISVIVGGIGIMNIMLVAVTERTREIGIRKAVGATNGAILSQFLIESIVVTSLGGIIGLILTFVIGMVIKAKTSLTPSITPDILIFAVALSIGAGIVFGLLPAMRAARKNPVEALRYE